MRNKQWSAVVTAWHKRVTPRLSGKGLLVKKIIAGRLLVYLIGAFLIGSGPSVANNKAAVRSFSLTYIVEVKDLPPDAQSLKMWAPYPVSDEDQTILDTSIVSPYPVSVTYDSSWGNRMMVIDTDAPKDFTFSVTYKVLRRERLSMPSTHNKEAAVADQGQYRRYLTPSKYAVINDAVRKMAREATKGLTNTQDKAHAIYRYVLANMKYDKSIPGWGKGDVERVCLTIGAGESGTGNCTDFHSLFASMMQAEGIPVIFEMGYPLKPGKDQIEPKEGGYHCWAKYFIAGIGWIPVDISEASKDPSKASYFDGAICENRLRFSVGRDIVLSPAQAGEPLNYFGPDPYIEVDGKAHTGYTRSISYKNL